LFLESKTRPRASYPCMGDPSSPPLRTLPAVSWLGLAISLFALLIVRQVVTVMWPALPLSAVIVREALNWICAIALLVIVRRGENLPFTSIGIGTRSWGKSILWSLAIFVACMVVGGLLVHLTGYGKGPASAAIDRLPVWMVTLVVLRAGVVEELFYRGYAIERLQAFGLNRFVAAGIPLIIFAVGHWTGGAANILIALALGAILAGFYLWHRDLVANMIGHFAVDFVANVLPKLFS
jgi:membrane protease YdiL (CAAX protease family)